MNSKIKKEFQRIDDCIDDLWKESRIKANNVEYGPVDNRSTAPAEEVIQLILDHLGLEISSKPSQFKLTKKEILIYE